MCSTLPIYHGLVGVLSLCGNDKCVLALMPPESSRRCVPEFMRMASHNFYSSMKLTLSCSSIFFIHVFQKKNTYSISTSTNLSG